MTIYGKSLAYLIAAGCGVIYIIAIVEIFGRVLVPNPINEWLIEKLATAGHGVAYTIAIYSHDFLIYIIVAVPFALMLSLLRPRYSWKYLIAALIASLAAHYWLPLTEPDRLMHLVQSWRFWVGLGMSVLGLPIAFVTMTLLGRRGTVPAAETQ